MSLAIETNSQGVESTSPRVVSDLSTASGPIECNGDLAVEGSVGRGVAVRARGKVTVGKLVEAADIVCNGVLKVEDSIIGGRIVAYQGFTCRQIGDARATATQVVIGIDEFSLEWAERRLLEIQAGRQKAEAFLNRLSPMLQQVKTLSAAQKEQLTELLSQGQELQQRANAATEQLRARLNDAAERPIPVCAVGGELFAGVTFVFPGGACEVGSASKGPIEIHSIKLGQTRALQLKFLQTGKHQPLQPVTHPCRTAELLKRLG